MDIVAKYKHTKLGTALFNYCAKATKFLLKHKWLYFVLAYTWGIISTLISWLTILFLSIGKLFSKKIQISKYLWSYNIKVGPDYWGGVTLGTVICRDQKSSDSYINPHEFGHTFQYCILGPFAFFIMAIPSFTRYWLREWFPKKEWPPYDGAWFEDAATQCGEYAVNYLKEHTMTNFQKFFLHLKTVNTHRKYVRQWAFKMGIAWRGLTHDLSKYSPAEFKIYKYATGKESPNHEVRRQLGYSPTHYIHTNRNKHHFDYWLDIGDLQHINTIKIPYEYVVEMFCDMCSTGRTYGKENWKLTDPLAYYNVNFVGHKPMHEKSAWLLKTLLTNLAEINDEKLFFSWYKLNKKDLIKKYKEA